MAFGSSNSTPYFLGAVSGRRPKRYDHNGADFDIKVFSRDLIFDSTGHLSAVTAESERYSVTVAGP